MAWRDFPLPDGTYADVARPWSQQDLYNFLPVFAEGTGTRSPMKLAMAPGLQVFANVGDGPHRGARDVEGTAFVVSGQTAYKVSMRDGTATALGTIPGTGLVAMTHNQITDGNEVVFGNGVSGYVYNTKTGTFGQITDDAFPGFRSVDFLNQYVLGVEPMRRYWFHSDLVSATSYNALNQYQAETSPDRIVGLCVSHNEALIFGERTIEPWVNAPTDNAAFQLNTSAVIEKGCAAAATIVRLDNSVFFLGSDKIVYRLQGYQPVPVSTKPMEAAWRNLDASRAFAFAYEDRGHVVYYLTFPDGHTWGFDVSVSRWHRRESFLLNRWRLNTLFKSNGEWFGGDFQTGKLYRLAWGYPYEGCELMPRGWRSGVLHSQGNRTAFHGLKVLLDTGNAPPDPPSEMAPTISGALPDGTVGDIVNYQYTVTPAFPGQVVTLTVNGTFPPGLTLNSSGHVTGQFTSSGTYAFTIVPSSECGQGAGLSETVVVGDTAVSAILDDAPILYWVLDETAGPSIADYSGFNRHGTVTGSPTLTGAGITLDGASGQGVYYPGNVAGSVLDVATDNSWAIEAVVTRAGNGGSVRETIACQWLSPNFGYIDSVLALGGYGAGTTGRPFGGYSKSADPSVLRVAMGPSALSTGVRTHVLITRDSADDTLKLYINGSLTTTSSAYPGEVGAASNGAKFLVGSDADTSNYYPGSYQFNGTIEHVAVYDKTISAARALYHAQVLGLA